MTPEKAATVAEFLISWIETEFDTTRKVLAAVPDDKADYKPAEKNMSAGDLAAHIAQTDIWFLESILKAEFTFDGPPPPAPAPSQTLADYEARIPELVKQVKSLTPEQWAKPVQFFTWTNALVTYLQFYVVHGVHHRGQLSAYLRPIGARVPSIYGGSADEPMTAAQQA